MPSFHTKTIESILDPVAQQVSRLVILHEEAEGGNTIPDLTRPVLTVKQAVENLVQIGYETVSTSEDAILKEDMPTALRRVEQASKYLLEAAQMLKDDPSSSVARKHLIEGSRGILQGTSGLLLAFDESEVRKIIAQCRGVLDYIAISEVIETMEDLVTFVKNVSPGLTSMAKQIDDRSKELTNTAHAEILSRCLDQIKALTPLLISSIKMFVSVSANSNNQSAVEECKASRNAVSKEMCAEIQEIIRVLQIPSSSTDKVDGTATESALRQLLNTAFSNQQEINDWLRDPQSMPNDPGDKALAKLLSAVDDTVNQCTDPHLRHAIKKASGDIRSMAEALRELKASGQGDSKQAMMLGKAIEEKIAELQGLLAKAVAVDEMPQVAHANTLQSKVQVAQLWLSDPLKHSINGARAVNSIISDGRSLAASLPDGKTKRALLALCDETENYAEELSNLRLMNKGGSAQAKNTANLLSSKLAELSQCMTDALSRKMVDDFVDVSGPLKALSAAAFTPIEEPNRDETYREKADDFGAHSTSLCDSALLVSGGTVNPRGGNISQKAQADIDSTVRKVRQVTPQVIRAGNIVLMDPSSNSSAEHFNLLKQQWTDNVDKVVGLLDGVVDTASFLKASEAAIIADTNKVEGGIEHNEPMSVIENAASIARRANRVIQVANQEIENCEDPNFQQQLSECAVGLKNAVPQMILSAKSLSLDPTHPKLAEDWRRANGNILDIIGDLRRVVTPPEAAEDKINSDLSSLSFANNGSAESAPPRPPLPQLNEEAELPSPPRPPPPSSTALPDPDAEMERVFKYEPQENQPIMMAAHDLHEEVRYWESADNELIQAAKQMALLMARLSQLVRGEGGSKKDLIDTARAIAEHSEIVARLAKGLAADCTDRRMRMNLLQICERIPTIGTQLKILSTVKATMLGSQGSQEDDEATEMLVGNAQNLMESVRDTVRAAEAASIKIRVQSGFTIRWVRRRPWYIE